MLSFFRTPSRTIIAVQTKSELESSDVSKLCWLFDNAELLNEQKVEGVFSGPRREMITPWSTNAVEITQNMGVQGILRIEEFVPMDSTAEIDPLLQREYNGLDQEIFDITKQPEPVIYIDDVAAYNEQE